MSSILSPAIWYSTRTPDLRAFHIKPKD